MDENIEHNETSIDNNHCEENQTMSKEITHPTFLSMKSLEASKNLFVHLLKKNYIIPINKEQSLSGISNKSDGSIINFQYLLGHAPISLVFGKNNQHLHISLFNHENNKVQVLYFQIVKLVNLWNCTPRRKDLAVEICRQMEKCIQEVIKYTNLYPHILADVPSWLKACASPSPNEQNRLNPQEREERFQKFFKNKERVQALETALRDNLHYVNYLKMHYKCNILSIEETYKTYALLLEHISQKLNIQKQ